MVVTAVPLAAVAQTVPDPVPAGPVRAQLEIAGPARPIDPIAGILNAFATHDVVALGEGTHNNEQGAAFRQKLFRDPRFPTTVNTVVVECGNSRYQAMMDRYIDGEDIPEKELRKAWLETMALGTSCDVPIYADEFRTIRDINRRLPKARHVRVLLGEVPYFAERGDSVRTDTFPAGLVRKEVQEKRHKVLIVYGEGHLFRRPDTRKLGPPGFHAPESIVANLEKAGVRVFSVWTHAPRTGADLATLQPNVATWPKPSFTMIKGTPLGLAPFPFYEPMGSGVIIFNGIRTELEGPPGLMQDQFDALIYLGPTSEITFAKLSASLCSDPDYVAMRAARFGDVKTLDGRLMSDDFRAQCAAVAAGR